MATVLKLYKNIPLDPRYEHTIGWASFSDQASYFNMKGLALNGGITFTDFSWLRKSRSIKVPMNFDEVGEGYNYCSVNNDGKNYYYFILDRRYSRNGLTELIVELDVMQTYMFDWDIPACFVEREHVSDDGLGKHLILEGLEVGEYTNTGIAELEEIEPMAVIVQSSVYLTNDKFGQPVPGSTVSNVFSGFFLYCCTAEAAGLTNLVNTINKLSEDGRADAIAAMWMYPKAMINADWANEGSELLRVGGANIKVFSSSEVQSLDGYVPRNKKLLSYPYAYIYVHNNMGGSAIYHYELFKDRYPTFTLVGHCGNDASVRLIPNYYRGADYDNESGLTLAGYPTCAWTQDAYKIWLAQNQASQDLAIFGGNVQVALGAATAAAGAAAAALDVINPLEGDGGAGGGRLMSQGLTQAYSGYMQVQGVLAARQDASVQPPQARGLQSGSVNMNVGMHTFTQSRKTITAEFAKILDSYFDMYGYKVSTVKKPNLSGRTYWNYVKTIGCVVLGNIDAIDRRKIGDIFDKGVTLWHDPEKMYRYDLAADNLEGVG